MSKIAVLALLSGAMASIASPPKGGWTGSLDLHPDMIEKYYPLFGMVLGRSGAVTVRCVRTSATLPADCAAVGENPLRYGFGTAASEAIAHVRFKQGYENTPEIGQVYYVPVEFGLDGRRHLPVLDFHWRTTPSRQDIEQVRPVGSEPYGMADIGCAKLRPSGEPDDCVVLSESPSAQGFGEAALKLSGRFRRAGMARISVSMEISFNVPMNITGFHSVNYWSIINDDIDPAFQNFRKVFDSESEGFSSHFEAYPSTEAIALAYRGDSREKASAKLDCLVEDDGRLSNCKIKADTINGIVAPDFELERFTG